MKKTVSAAIGSTNFTIDEDAYARLDSYLGAFRSRLSPGADNQEVMTELEMRIAELLSSKLSGEGRVVDIKMVDDVISQVGMPDGSSFSSRTRDYDSVGDGWQGEKPVHKIYRDPDHRSIGGVCSGLAAYFDLDITLVRALFLVLLLCASCGFWIYVVLWIIAPAAKTPTQKCELRGLEPTYENLSRFTTSK